MNKKQLVSKDVLFAGLIAGDGPGDSARGAYDFENKNALRRAEHREHLSKGVNKDLWLALGDLDAIALDNFGSGQQVFYYVGRGIQIWRGHVALDLRGFKISPDRHDLPI